ncbi:hypothetical protein ABZ135_07035 [Streptomyces sp. NPDC006339]|uniref:hypothetical protein n=1 Tax=Streptomyces sp. NPDC006339 TaxID=3156755 RepID=UPI0033BF3A30
MRPLARFPLAVLLVLAALLGVGSGAGAGIAEGESRIVSTAAEPGAETQETAETEATAPARAVRRPAVPRVPWRPAPDRRPVLVSVPPERGDAPRSAVMRC